MYFENLVIRCRRWWFYAKFAFFKIFGSSYRFVGCGHQAQFYEIVVISKRQYIAALEEGDLYCPQCVVEMGISCVRCKDTVFVGSLIVESPGECFQVSCSTDTHKENPLQTVMCRHCARIKTMVEPVVSSQSLIIGPPSFRMVPTPSNGQGNAPVFEGNFLNLTGIIESPENSNNGQYAGH